MSEFKLPTETITLPSKGLNLYPEGNVLNEGSIEMKYMGAKQEDILTNQNYINQGTVIDKLLESMIITKIKYEDLLVGDKNAILVAARILGLGKDYPVKYINDKGKIAHTVADLSKLENKKLIEIDLISQSKNQFTFTLPKSENIVTFKLLTHKDEKMIEADAAGMKKIFPEESFTTSTKLKRLITSINGKHDVAAVNEFVDNYLIKIDIEALLKRYAEVAPDIDMKFIPEDSDYTGEGIVITPGLDFFWSNLGI